VLARNHAVHRTGVNEEQSFPELLGSRRIPHGRRDLGYAHAADSMREMSRLRTHDVAIDAMDLTVG
jgi:hypothetical protein